MCRQAGGEGGGGAGRGQSGDKLVVGQQCTCMWRDGLSCLIPRVPCVLHVLYTVTVYTVCAAHIQGREEDTVILTIARNGGNNE